MDSSKYADHLQNLAFCARNALVALPANALGVVVDAIVWAELERDAVRARLAAPAPEAPKPEDAKAE